MSLDLSSSFHQFRISMAEGSKSSIFTFDNFKLDAGKLMLYRDGAEVSIPPKAARTLAAVVETAGTIISKEELIERIWDDSVVEESNLTQYLYLLRKILGNMPDGRPYIETLRRRGYRFNGEVTRFDEEPSPARFATEFRPAPTASFGGVEREGNVLRLVDWKPEESASDDPPAKAPQVAATVAAPTSWRKSLLSRLAIVGLAILMIGAGGVFVLPRFMPAASNAESQPREVSYVRLTNGVMPAAATISPDGNAFVYHEVDGDISRMFVQQTGQASRIEITNSTEKVYLAKTFSPGGQSIYYIAIDKKNGVFELYRIPTMGGSPVKVLDNVTGAVSFSPDGGEFIFVRRNASTNDSALIIADKDGRAERVFLQRKSPKVIVPSAAWSPNGKTILFGEIELADEGMAGNQTLYAADVATGQTTPVSDERWDNILRLVWLADGSGAVMIGTRANDGYSTRRDQVYFVSYPKGTSYRITVEGNRHEADSLGVTKSGEIFAVPTNRSSQVWSMPLDGSSSKAIQLTKGAADGRAGLSPLPDGRFAYLARTAEEINVMLSSPDGSNATQIATGFQFVEELRADPHGKFLIFSALKDGKNHMFRADIDGGAVKQLTFGNRAIDSAISPDGKYLTYDSTYFVDGIQRYALMRIPTDGGEPVTLKPEGCFLPTYSPDGSLLSCISTDKYDIMIISAADGSEVERHPLPVFATWNFGIGWTPDGSGLIYIVTEKGTSNLWVQPRSGGKQRSMTNFSSGIIYRYAFASNGSKLYIARGYPTQDAVLIRNFR